MPLRQPRDARNRSGASHAAAPKQERRVASALGGKPTPRSGAGDFVKGDVRVKGLARIECKGTRHGSFSVTRDMVRKIEEAALGSAEMPCIQIDFLDANGAVESSVAVVPLYALNMVCQCS